MHSIGPIVSGRKKNRANYPKSVNTQTLFSLKIYCFDMLNKALLVIALNTQKISSKILLLPVIGWRMYIVYATYAVKLKEQTLIHRKMSCFFFRSFVTIRSEIYKWVLSWFMHEICHHIIKYNGFYRFNIARWKASIGYD